MGPKTFPNYFKWAWAGINLITSVDSYRFKDSKKYDSLLLSSNGIGDVSKTSHLLLNEKFCSNNINFPKYSYFLMK